MTARMLQWSTVPSKTDPNATRYTGSLRDWYAHVSKIHGKQKNGLAFCGAVFKDDYRKRKNVERVDFLMLDFDDIEDLSPLKAISQYCYYAYSSYSHGIPGKSEKGKHRFRMLVPLASPVSSDGYDLLWNKVNEIVGGVLDAGARDASRLNYLRRHKAPDAELLPWDKANLDAPMFDPLDVDGWSVEDALADLEREKERQKQRAEARRQEMASMTDDEKYGWVEDALRYISAEDYQDWLTVGMALASARAEGFADAFSVWESWSSTSSKYKQGDCDAKWKTFDAGSTTLGTVWKMAEDAGWTRPQRTAATRSVDEMLGSYAAGRTAVTPVADVQGVGSVAVGQVEASTSTSPVVVEEDGALLRATNDHYLAERALRDIGHNENRAIFTGNEWMVYNEDKGVFIEDEDLVYRLVHDRYHNAQIAGDLNDDGEPKRLCATHGLKTRVEATARILAKPISKGFFNEPKAGLCFRNGFYNAHSGQLERHSPDNRQTKNIDLDYDESATCPTWDANMLDLFGDVEDGHLKIQLVEEFFGVAMLGESTRLAKTLFMLGDGRNGKSTIVSVMKHIMPEDSVCNVSPHKLSGNQADYWMLRLKNKRLNIVPDLSKRDLMDMGDWKAVVAGDEVSGRSPYGKPEDFIPRAGHIVLTNELPHVSDTSHGFWNRIIALKFERIFSEDQRDLNRSEKLRRERAGIVNRLLKAGQIALERGQYVDVPSVGRLTKQWQEESTPVVQFLHDVAEDLVLDYEGWIKSKDIYKAYKQWCEDTGRRPMNATNFGRELQKERVPKKRSNGYRYQVGVWLEDHKRDEVQDVPF